MIELQVKGTQSFMSKEIPVIEGGFGEGKKSMLVREISAIHRIKVGNINQRINDNREKFEDGVDIIDLKTDTSAVSVLKELGFTQAQIGNSNNIYLLSERGYAKLIKIMDTPLAWEIYNRLLDEYFTMRKIINSNVQEPEDELMIMSKAFLIATNKIKEQAEIIEHQDEQLNAIPNLIPLGTVKREQGRNLEDALIRLGYVVYKDARIVEYNHKYLVCGAKQIHVIKDNLYELLYRLNHDINTNGEVVPKSKLFAKND